MPLLSFCGGIFCVNYVTIMLQHKSVHGCFVFLKIFFPPTAALSPLFSTQLSGGVLDSSAPRPETFTDRKGGPTVGKWRCRHGNRLTDKGCYDARALMSNNMKYKKFITIMQAALGVAPLNKRELIPPPRKLWKPAQWVCVCVCVLTCCVCICVVCRYISNMRVSAWETGQTGVVKKSMYSQRESIYVNDSSAPCRPSNQKQPLMFNSHPNMFSHMFLLMQAPHMFTGLQICTTIFS